MLNRIKEIAIDCGASLCEIIPVKNIDISKYKEIVSTYPENLNYLKKFESRENLTNWFKSAKSVLICAYQYWNSELNYQKIISEINDPIIYFKKANRNIPSFILKNYIGRNFKISRYALSYDYHKIIREILKETLLKVNYEFKVEGKIFVDSSPIYEKGLAEIAGLGRQGKNTLIINEKAGSYFFLGGIALDIEIKNNNIIQKENLCKDCEICIKSCPTKALSPYKLNPIKCISYWTTHNKDKDIPIEIMKNNKGYIYGCDICQEICPYNLNIKISVNKKLKPIILK